MFPKRWFAQTIVKLGYSGREAKMMEMRYGEPDGVLHTVREVAKAFGVTQRRVELLELALLGEMKKMELKREITK